SAFETFSKAWELAPNDAVINNNLGTFYSELNQCEEAIQYYSKAIVLKDDYADAYSNRGDVYLQLGQYSLAFKDYAKVLELRPNDPEANDKFKNLVTFLFSSGHNKDIASILLSNNNALALEQNYVKHMVEFLGGLTSLASSVALQKV